MLISLQILNCGTEINPDVILVKCIIVVSKFQNAIDSAVGMGDQAIIVDILDILVQKK